MIKKLTLQGLRADLGQAREMLASAREANDVVATLQFDHRVQALEADLAAIEASQETIATAAIFFGGRPVVGSRGIDATFASKALDCFQRMLSRQFAHMEGGELGSRGPVVARDEARMIVTDLARGSVGFVLEESPEQGQIVETQLGTAVGALGEAIHRLAGDTEEWVDTLEELDDRVMSEVKAFFAVLDDAGASFRLVEGENDREISQSGIHRARERVDLTRITQEEMPWMVGQIVGFTSKTFEFLTDTGEKLAGRIDRLPARKLEEAGLNNAIQQVMFVPLRVKFRVRTVKSGTWSRRYLTLVAIDDR